MLLRANSVKAQIADIEALKSKMESKDEGIIELKKQLKMKVSIIIYRLFDSLVVECWLRVRGGPGFNPQSRNASYQRRYKNGTSSSLV